MVGGAVPVRAVRRVVSQVREVARIDNRRHCLACRGQDADNPALTEVRVEAQPYEVPFLQEWHLPDVNKPAVRTVELPLTGGEQDLSQLGYHARPEFHTSHESSSRIWYG